MAVSNSGLMQQQLAGMAGDVGSMNPPVPAFPGEPDRLPWSMQKGGYGTTAKPDRKKPSMGGGGTKGKNPATCHCCGAVGYYTKSCGKKHQCLKGLCKGDVPSFIKDQVGKRPEDERHKDVPIYRVFCPQCDRENRFEVPRDGTVEIECWGCNNPMTVRLVTEQGAKKHGIF